MHLFFPILFFAIIFIAILLFEIILRYKNKNEYDSENFDTCEKHQSYRTPGYSTVCKYCNCTCGSCFCFNKILREKYYEN
jgi:hypothetical protein